MLLAYAGKNEIFGKIKVVARGSLLVAKVKPYFVWFTTLKSAFFLSSSAPSIYLADNRIERDTCPLKLYLGSRLLAL